MNKSSIWRLTVALAVAVVVGLWLSKEKRSAPNSPGSGELSNHTQNPPQQGPRSADRVDEAQQKVRLLKSILATGNDNDPRLDSEFWNLSAGAKAALIDYYGELPRAHANERGTLVFLLGRNITETGDLTFFSRVLAEPIQVQVHPTADPEFPSALLAAYPQVMAIRALGELIKQPAEEGLRNRALAELKSAARSPNLEVSSKARKALLR